MNEIINLLGKFEDELAKNTLLSDYYDWLLNRNASFVKIERLSISESYEDNEIALEKAEGQWYFAKTVFRGTQGFLYHGTNAGGNHFVQYKFFELDETNDNKDSYPGIVFWRLDKRESEGYYLALKIYYTDGSDNKKRPNVLKCKSLFSNLAKETDLKSADISNKGRKEIEIGKFLIRDNNPTKLSKEIPHFHNQFIELL